MTGAGTPPLLLIHGSPGNGDVWNNVAAALSVETEVLKPTLAGHSADRETPIADIEVSAIAAQLEALFSEKHQAVDVVGHSFGGVVAPRLALRQKLSIRRLLLLEPVAISIFRATEDTETFEAVRGVFDDYIARHGAGEADAVSRMIDFWFGPDSYAGMPEPVQAYLRANTAINIRDVQATFREAYDLHELSALSTQTLIAYGSKSPSETIAIATTLADCLGAARTKSIDNANHAMLTTHPTDIAALIEGFLYA